MKHLITILSLMLVTGIVACNKKNSGGGNSPQAQPIYPNSYSHNDLYMGPEYEDVGQPGTIVDLPGCINPPPMFSDIYQECAWLAVNTDCDTEATNKRFIDRCYNLNLNRPGCSFPAQPITVCKSNCGGSSGAIYDHTYSDDTYSSNTRRVRSRTVRPRVIRSDRTEERRGVVSEDTQSRVVTPVVVVPPPSNSTPVSVPEAPQKTSTEDISFDNRGCQWIVTLHNRIKGGTPWASWARTYIAEANLVGMTSEQKKSFVNRTLSDVSVLSSSYRPNGSALGDDLQIIENQLIRNGKNETIIRCDDRNRTITTTFDEGNYGVTRIYEWDGDSTENGEVLIRSSAEFSGVTDTSGKISQATLMTAQIVIWKKEVSEGSVREKFEKDSRILDLNDSLLENSNKIKASLR